MRANHASLSEIGSLNMFNMIVSDDIYFLTNEVFIVL